MAERIKVTMKVTEKDPAKEVTQLHVCVGGKEAKKDNEQEEENRIMKRREAAFQHHMWWFW